MTDNRPVEPLYDALTDWEYEWYAFMDRFKLWKKELFDGKVISEKDVWDNVKATTLHNGLNETKRLEREQIWKQYCWKNLCVAINKYNKVKERRSWEAESDGYKFKWLISLHLDPTKTINDAYYAASTFCQAVSWVDKADYCVEFYTDNGCHPHAHILVYTNNKRMSCISNLRNSLIKNNKICNPELRRMLVKPTNIDIKNSNINTYEYIQGIKKESKKDNVSCDKHLRELNNLEDFYTFKR